MKLGRQRKDQYVNRLRDFMKRANNREEKLLHELIIFAMIEARSCERFRLLSLHISEDELKEFYHRFMVSEAGHYKLFLKLAKQYFTEELAQETWKEMLAFEADLLGDMELRGDRMH